MPLDDSDMSIQTLKTLLILSSCLLATNAAESHASHSKESETQQGWGWESREGKIAPSCICRV